MAVETDVCAHLVARLGLVMGLDIMAGVNRPGHGRQVFVAPTGGMPTMLFKGGGQVTMHTVQVSVWSPAAEYQAGIELARACITALHRVRVPGYLVSLVREADPSPIGYDEDGRYGFAINVELEKETRHGR